MSQTPYKANESVLVTIDGEDREAVVSLVVQTEALDPTRRWRLLCRWADEPGVSIEMPLYCDDNGCGPGISPMGDRV